MIEIPEAFALARQVNENLAGRTIEAVIAGASPHKFAWLNCEPAGYTALLQGSQFVSAISHGGMLEIQTDRSNLLFQDGVNLRLHPEAGEIPEKHQLLLTLQDGGALSASVQMYGGLFCWDNRETFDYSYYNVAQEKPSPLDTTRFTESYFLQILAAPEVQKGSIKAALATNQRIPGLGNGVLQDILWNARLSPKRKVSSLSAGETRDLYSAITGTLAEMSRLGGRDTEKNLCGFPGGYITVMSARNAGAPCPECGAPIIKEPYMGGSVYYCARCQPV